MKKQKDQSDKKDKKATLHAEQEGQTDGVTDAIDTDSTDTVDTPDAVENDGPQTDGDDSIDDIELDPVDLQQKVLDLTKERDNFSQQIPDYKDQALRALAELENVKRRKEQEKTDAIKYANEKVFIDLLPVLDSFTLAIQQSQAVSDDAQPASKQMVEGVQMIQKQIEQFLEKFGVTKIEAVDKPFDPNLHQGVSSEAHPDKEPQTIVSEMQAGYMLNDRVLRPSMVVVSTK